jgi:hypothetical protein
VPLVIEDVIPGKFIIDYITGALLKKKFFGV